MAERRRPAWSLRWLSLLLAVTTAALSAAPPAQALDGWTLRNKLARETALLGPWTSMLVRDVESGRTLFASDPDRPLVPASNTKLLVTATALLRMGPDSSLRTTVVANVPPVDGVIHGDIVIVGGGDPYLTGRQIDAMAAQIVAAGVRSITGRVLADAAMLDTRISARATGFSFDRELGGRLAALVVDRGAGSDPAMTAALSLHNHLREAGVRLGGLPRTGRASPEGVEIAWNDSRPLGQMIASVNIPSDNFASEMLLKVLGAQLGGGGTTAAGAAVVRETLGADLGIAPKVFDGSGLSRANRISARQLVRLLTHMATDPAAADAFFDSLPVAGRTGTLKRRMRGLPAQDSCRAKTGTLRDASSLAGYCIDAAGRTVAFAFIENHVCTPCAKRIEDRMANAIARYA